MTTSDAPSRRQVQRESIPRESLADALAAWAETTACAPLPDALDERALRWLRAVWESGATYVPLTFVYDLGFVLLLGRGFSFRGLRVRSDDDATGDSVGSKFDRNDDDSNDDDSNEAVPVSAAEERRAFARFALSYQDRIVAPWLSDPVIRDLHIYIAGLAPDAQDVAIGHALALAFGPALAQVPGLLEGSAAFVRAKIQSTPNANAQSETSPPGAQLRAVDDEWLSWSKNSLEPALGVLSRLDLFSPEDAWEIAHLDRLPSESTRLALRQVHRVSGEIGALAAGSALSMRQRAREVPVDDVDVASYPTGGFDAISTQGSFENLVRSEIAYVGEGKQTAAGFDLFDVRFAENELLFYTRDESPVLDAFRQLVVVIDEPERMRTKVKDASAQTGVLVLGLMLALQADMIRAFGAAASHSRVVFCVRSDGDVVAASEDEGLVSISLASEILHRRATVETTVDEASDVATARGAVVFSLRPPPVHHAALAWIRVDGPQWTWEDSVIPCGDPLALRALGDALLLAVAGGKRRKS